MSYSTDYNAAHARVNANPELDAHRDTIFADWTEADPETNGSHYGWVATAPIGEIVAWAEDIERAATAEATANPQDI